MVLPASYNELEIEEKLNPHSFVTIFEKTKFALEKANVIIDANDKSTFTDIGYIASHGK